MMRALRIWPALGLVVLLVSLLPGSVAGQAVPVQSVTPEPFPFSDRYPAEIRLESQAQTDLLVRLEIIVENVRLAGGGYARPGDPFRPLIATVYVSPAEAERLAAAGLDAQPIPNESLRAWRLYGPDQPSGWPTYDQWVARMQTLATNYPNIVRMVSIGTSVQGRQLWWLKITDNPDVQEDEPEFRYISTMHGNEPVGAEMILRLAELLTAGYGVDPALTALVDGMEIWLMPLFNPDGYMAGSRWNANGVDLNRDFPDRITDPNDDPAGREPETQAIMNWSYGMSFTMGANYHAGALVVNYPWDSVPQPPDNAPDDALFYTYSVGYASRNSMIWNGGFPSGVTRGWEWYIVRGGLQDWAYYWHDEHHVTIEVSNQQPPAYSQMNTYWTANKDAMLWWMARPLRGVRGLVTDATTGQPLAATVDVVEVSKPMATDPDVGDYHRMLEPGTYTVRCSAAGYVDQTWTVQVVDGPATVQNCAMLPPVVQKLHVGMIKPQYVDRGGGRYLVNGAVRILDESGHNAGAATVDVQWTLPNGATLDQQATTDSRGLAKFRLKSRLAGLYRLCVTAVAKAGYVYDPAANVETCDAVTIP